MLKKRLVPKLLIRERQIGASLRPVLVTTKQFVSSIDVGDPVSQAKIYQAQMADELIVLNIDRTPIADDSGMLNLIERLAAETFMPLAVGGGVWKVTDFELLLDHGADKVVVNSAVLKNPSLIDAAARRFGAQCVVVSIDYRRNGDGEPQVFAEGARTSAGISPIVWAKEAVERGAGEIVLVDADRDGMGQGLDVELSRIIAAEISVPVILSGGCGLASHFSEGFQVGGAEAVSAGTFFAFKDQNPIQTRSHIRNSGVPVRMQT